MVSPDYVVLAADVVRRTTRIAVIRPASGPREGTEIMVPITAFELAEEVDKDDDEVVLARWFAEKEGLLPVPV